MSDQNPSSSNAGHERPRRSYAGYFERHPDRRRWPELVIHQDDEQLFDLILRCRYLDSNDIINVMRRWPIRLEKRRTSGARNPKAIKHRLTQLFQAGYLDRPEQQQGRRAANRLYTKHMIYTPGPKLLPKRERARERNQGEYIEHETGLAHTLLVFALAAEECDVPFSFETGIDWQRRTRFRHLPAGEGRRLSFKPDAFFELAGQNFFLEFDTGTEAITRSDGRQTSIEKKLLTYAHFFQRGFYKDLGLPGFSLLFVVAPRYADDLAAAEDRVATLVAKAREIWPSWLFKATTIHGVRSEDPAALLTSPVWFSSSNAEGAGEPVALA